MSRLNHLLEKTADIQSLEDWKERHYYPLVEENQKWQQALSERLQHEIETVKSGHETTLKLIESKNECACLELKNELSGERIRQLEIELEHVRGAYGELRRITLPGSGFQPVSAQPQESTDATLTHKLSEDLTTERQKVQNLLQKLKQVEESKSELMTRWEKEMMEQKRSLEAVRIGEEKYSKLINDLTAMNNELLRDKQAALDREKKLQAKIAQVGADFTEKGFEDIENAGLRALVPISRRGPSLSNSSEPSNLVPVRVTDVPGWEKFKTEAEEGLNYYGTKMAAIMLPKADEAELSPECIIKKLIQTGTFGKDERIKQLVGLCRERLDADFENLAARSDPTDSEATSMMKRQLTAAWFQVAELEWGRKKSNVLTFPLFLASHDLLSEIAQWLANKSAEDAEIPSENQQI